MRLRAESKGIYTCPNCNTDDIFFSLNDKCDKCSSKIPEKPKLLKMHFAIEVLLYFINNFDEQFPPGESKNLYINGGRRLIEILESTNSSSLSKDEFDKFQYLTRLIPILGGNKFGGAINLNPPSVKILDACPNPLTVGKSLASVYWSVNYINNFKIL